MRAEGQFQGGGRTLRLGYRHSLGRFFDVNLDGVRRESANDDAPEHGRTLRCALRWQGVTKHGKDRVYRPASDLASGTFQDRVT